MEALSLGEGLPHSRGFHIFSCNCSGSASLRRPFLSDSKWFECSKESSIPPKLCGPLYFLGFKSSFPVKGSTLGLALNVEMSPVDRESNENKDSN